MFLTAVHVASPIGLAARNVDYVWLFSNGKALVLLSVGRGGRQLAPHLQEFVKRQVSHSARGTNS